MVPALLGGYITARFAQDAGLAEGKIFSFLLRGQKRKGFALW